MHPAKALSRWIASRGNRVRSGHERTGGAATLTFELETDSLDDRSNLEAALSRLGPLERQTLRVAYDNHRQVEEAARQRPELAHLLSPIVSASLNMGKETAADVLRGGHRSP